jgi:hypothetical protein
MRHPAFGNLEPGRSKAPSRRLPISLNAKYPEELLWNGRVPDQNFDPDELLYFRTPEFNESGHVDAVHIRFPDTSVNRGKYSSPQSVLLASIPRFLKHKVAEFKVRDIPANTRSGDGRVFDISIVHDPVKPPAEEENYAHSEIRCFDRGVRRQRVSAVAEKYVREILGMAMRRAQQ